MGHPVEPQNGPESCCKNVNLPPAVSKRYKKHKSKPRRGSSSDQSDEEPVKVLVKEDVYLMENKVQRINTNLLVNSLTARLRQSIPENVNVGPSAMNKLRRNSVKDLVHLENLNRQYTNEMNWESNRINKESYKLIKRHYSMKKHSEYQKKNQEKLEAQMRTRSGFSSVSLLPRLVDSAASTIESPVREKTREKFSEFAFVDKDDTSFVKVFKLNGVFQPHNKYGSRNDLNLPLKTKKPGVDSQDVAILDSDSPIDLPFKPKSRKGLSVTWCNSSQYYDNYDSEIDSKAPSRADTRSEILASSMSREEKDGTPNTTISTRTVKSDSFMWRKPKYTKGKSKVDAIGLKWQVPKEAQRPPSERRDSRKVGKASKARNLVPVTTALDREGLSPTRMKWQVHPMQSPSVMDMYVEWIDKLEDLKRSPTVLSKSPDIKHKHGRTSEMPIVSVPM